jgi:hypothetical protein
MKFAVLIAAPLIAFASAALADEAIATHGDAAPAAEAPVDQATAQDRQKQANGAWARRVLAGQATDEAAADKDSGKRCPQQGDGKPHGEVWAGVGTGGYRNVGGVVTQPIGDCAQVTVAIDHSQFDGARRRRR